MKSIYINKISSFDYTVGEYTGIPCAKIADPDYKSIISNANMRRRMSRVIKMGVSSALICLGNQADIALDGIITATGWGCLEDTEKFLNDMIKYDEGSLNPTTFIQSTFNTIGAQIALLLSAKAYNMTYVHRSLSLESALTDAMLLLNEGKQNVLVGAFDELTSSSFTTLRRLGIYRNCLAGEGVNFFLLGTDKTDTTLAQIKGLTTLPTGTNSDSVSESVIRFLSVYGLHPSDLSLIALGKNGKLASDRIYDEVISILALKDASVLLFKQTCGEYPTAMAFGLVKTVEQLSSNSEVGSYALLLNIDEAFGSSLILIQH